MINRTLSDCAYRRACSFPLRGSLSSDFASKIKYGKPFPSNNKKSTKPSCVLSKSLPNASTAFFVIFTLFSKAIFAVPFSSSKNLQPDTWSKLLILMRAFASFCIIIFLLLYRYVAEAIDLQHSQFLSVFFHLHQFVFAYHLRFHLQIQNIMFLVGVFGSPITP